MILSRNVNLNGVNLASAFAVFVLSALFGCAPEVEKKPFNTTWPLPPAEPKVRHIEIIESGDDMIAPAKSDWVKRLIGGEEDIETRLRRPYGVAVDDEGRIYVTDVGRVFVFDKKKNTIFFIGNKGKEQLKMPIGIAVDSDGKVYVADAAYDRVFIYKDDGNFIGTIGVAGEMKSPAGLAIDKTKGRLYAADTKKNIVMAYALDGKPIFTIEGYGMGKGRFNFPTNIAVDAEGNIFIVDTGNFSVQVFSPDGIYLRTIKGGRPKLFARPKGIAFNSEGNMLIVDAASQKVFVLQKDGSLLFTVGEGGIEPGQFSVPAGIAVDAADRVYVVDQMNGRVQVFQYLSEKWKAAQSPKKN